ncbi:MAG TPA: hypothetical protein VMN39_00900 [Longimicrobiaceae bacterium]|nr:hypothetical protein [Longimicrobiaceae bacterium]
MFLLLFAAAVEAGAQAPASYRAGAPYLYVDCRRCDLAHLRQEIPFVNHMRDPADAQIHVLIGDEDTGGGGRRYSLQFLGRGEFSGFDHTLSYTSPVIRTEAEERDGLTGTLKLGLVPYVARTSLGSYLEVVFTSKPPAEADFNHGSFHDAPA